MQNLEAQWLKPVSEIFGTLPKNCWIAGGAMRSFLTGEKPKDIDIFTNDVASVIGWFESNNEYIATFGNEFFQNYKNNGLTFQVIKKYTYASPDETINSFDFTCIAAAFGENGFTCHERFYLDNAQKKLVINELPLPLSTLKRSLKYAARGYNLCPVSLSRLVRTINELEVDWDNPDQNQIDFYPDGTPTFRGKD